MEKAKRLAQLSRAPTDSLPPFHLTKRDVAILVALFEYRALTAPQIATLFFQSEHGEVNTRCKHRLQMLYHYGYLRRDEQPSKLSEGRKPLVYFLDREGAALLREKEGFDLHGNEHKLDVTHLFLEHLLLTNDMRLAFLKSAHKHGFDLEKWLDDKTLKSPQIKDKVVLKGKGGAHLRAAVVPDGYFRLKTQGDSYNFFVEIDRGTVTGETTEWGRRDWGRKVKVYLEYHRSGLYEKRYRTADMRILTLTTSETRLSNLKRITEEAGGKARFWFSTYERIRGGDILTDSLWSVAARDGSFCLTGSM